jgi:hypothetical protein
MWYIFIKFINKDVEEDEYASKRQTESLADQGASLT